jgi:hypothetical protein
MVRLPISSFKPQLRGQRAGQNVLAMEVAGDEWEKIMLDKGAIFWCRQLG